MVYLTVRQRIAALVLLVFLMLGGVLLYIDGGRDEITVNLSGRESEPIYVHLCGAVRKPGVVKAVPGTRKFQLLEMAGGALPEADLGRVNLAEFALDGEQIYLPKQGEVLVTPKPAKQARNSKAQGSGKDTATPAPAIRWPVSLNQANRQELEAVPGIGPALAAAIIDYRLKNGAFPSYEELGKVPGIGVKKLENFRPFLFVP
jgi:competence protein ComEA